MNNNKLTGSCLCQSIQLTCTPISLDVGACHCTQCRKFSGHQFATFDTRARDLHIKDPKDALRHYRASSFATRSFCSICGSSLFWRADTSDNYSVLAGCLDDSGDLQLTKHIFTADKGAYYQISDGLPQYSEGS